MSKPVANPDDGTNAALEALLVQQRVQLAAAAQSNDEVKARTVAQLSRKQKRALQRQATKSGRGPIHPDELIEVRADPSKPGHVTIRFRDDWFATIPAPSSATMDALWGVAVGALLATAAAWVGAKLAGNNTKAEPREPS